MDCHYLDLRYYPTNMPGIYIAQVAVLSVVFPLSFVGMVLNIVFNCRRKTNFLVRRIVYITVITTLHLGALWLRSILAFKLVESMFNLCNELNNLYFSVASSLLCIMALLVCSIYFTLVTKLCGFFSRRHPWTDRFHLLLEYLFVMILLLAGLTLSVLLYYTRKTFTMSITQKILIAAIPPALVLISLIGNVVLTIWVCTLWRRQIERRRDVLKEIVIFFALFFLTLLVFGMNLCIFFTMIPQTVLSPPLSCFSFLVFGYMCYSFRHVRFANRTDMRRLVEDYELLHPPLESAYLRTQPIMLPTFWAQAQLSLQKWHHW